MRALDSDYLLKAMQHDSIKCPECIKMVAHTSCLVDTPPVNPMSDLDNHGSGCFPCRLGKRTGRTKGGNTLSSTSTSTKESEVKTQSDGTPTTAQYALEATKKTVEILAGVASLSPIPIVKEVLGLGLKIINTCEAINDVQKRVAGLKNRIAGILLVIAKVTKDPTQSIATSELSDELGRDLGGLKECLASIAERLDAVQQQNVWLTGLLSKPNLDLIDDCEVELQSGLSRFQTLQTLYVAQDLATIQQQLVKLYGITEGMAIDVKDTREKVFEIEGSVNELKAMLTKNAAGASTVLARMPRSPDVFFGRDVIVQRIAKQLCSGDTIQTRISIVGPGGVGKTSAALAIMEHDLVKQSFTQQHRFWVPCISANSPTIFLALLTKHLRAERKTEDPLEDIISTLQETNDPRIILLDNFETPWHPVEGSQDTIKLVIEALDALPHVAILTTMRSEFSPLDKWKCERLSQVRPEDSRRIYTAIDADAGEYSELNELLDALGHLPYAITLMASRGKRSFSSPPQLLEEWRAKGTSMLSKPEEGIDHSISLSIDSKFVTSSPGAIHLLQILSMLPAGIYHNDLSIWADGWQSEAIDTLRDAALVLTREVNTGKGKKNHLFVVPVVQSHMKHRRRIPQDVRDQVHNACYRFLANHAISIDGPNEPLFKEHAAAILSQETNIQALLTTMIKDFQSDLDSPPPYNFRRSTNPLTRKERLQALLAFAWYQCWVKPRPEKLEQITFLARKSGEPSIEAEALFCLGSVFAAMTKSELSRQMLMEAQTLYRCLEDRFMELRIELMDIDLDADFGDFDQATARMSTTRSRWEGYFQGDTSYKAWFMFHDGQIDFYQNRLDDVLTKLKEAQQLFSGLEKPGYLQIALSIHFQARAYSSMGNSTRALEFINAAIEGYKPLYGDGMASPHWADSHIIKARILKGADRWDAELEETLKVTLESYQELGLSRQISQCLVEFGEIYVRRQDWAAARLAYEEALKKNSGLQDYTSVWARGEAEQNLEYIEYMLTKNLTEDTRSVVEFRPPYRS